MFAFKLFFEKKTTTYERENATRTQLNLDTFTVNDFIYAVNIC